MAQVLAVAVGADHAGFELKQRIAAHLSAQGHRVHDCGTGSTAAVDYPRFAREVAVLVAAGTCEFGIMVDGAGVGSAIAANKVPGVLAAACYNEQLARNAREHNDANVLTLGASQVDADLALAIVDVFLGTACTVERHRARVAMIREIEREQRSGAALDVAPDLTTEDIARIAARVKALLESPVVASDETTLLTPAELAKLIDHTLLRPEATTADIERLCREARTQGFYSVCVNPAYVKHARYLLRDARTKVCCVVGFPLGAQPSEIKVLEARRAIRDGAAEIDMVINIGALKSGDDEMVWKDIRGVVEVCRDGRALTKVILETALLTDEEKVRGCELAMKAGADFVKTSTGFSSGGATEEDIALMSRTVAARKLGVKASGGIRSYADVVRMVRAGATRVGCSSSVKIMDEATAAFGGRKE